MDKHPLLCLILFVMLYTPGDAIGQADVEALRQAREQAIATFFDDSQSVETRLEAIAQVGYPDDETFDRLIELGATKTEDDRIRLKALETARFDQRYIDTVLAIIADEAESDMLASELIYDVTQRTTFRQPAELRQTLQAALRQRLDDERDLTRLAAYRTLVASHDVVAIDRIVNGLIDGSPPIPPADAIQLLDTDGPTRHIQTVRPFIESADPVVQAQAVRVLAVDPDSRPAVVELASSPETAPQVRVHALRALSREDSEYFAYALRLISNRQENPDVRYAAMEGGMARLNYHNVPPDLQVQYGRAIEGVSRTASGQVTSDGKDLAAEAKQLLAHLRKYFPAIRRALS